MCSFCDTDQTLFYFLKSWWKEGSGVQSDVLTEVEAHYYKWETCVIRLKVKVTEIMFN